MFRRKLIPVWVGVALLSGMFLMGQDGWPPCIDLDTDGYGNPASDSCAFSSVDCKDFDPQVNPGAREGPEGDPTCSDTVDNDCDGTTDLDDIGCALVRSQLIVDQIEPTYFGQPTNQVDVKRGICELYYGEPFRDYFADVTLSNRPFPTEPGEGTTLYLARYEIIYIPVTQGAPSLESIVVPMTLEIPYCPPGDDPCSVTTFIAEFVPVRQKEVMNQFLQQNPTITQLTYNIDYTFFGDNYFEEEVSGDGFSFFYAANYDNCWVGE